MAAAMAAVVVLGLAGLAAFVHLPAGERLLVHVAARAVPGLTIEDVELEWPFTVSARKLRMADDRGEWLLVERPVIDWHPLRLLRRQLDIDRLAAESVVVRRLPAPDPAPAEESGPAGRPFGLRVDALATRIVLEEAVAGERIALDLAGTATLRDDGGGMVDVRLLSPEGDGAIVSGTAGRQALDLRWSLFVPRLERWQGLAGIDLSGQLAASGTIGGSLSAPVITANADIGAGGAAGMAWGQLTASATALAAGPLWQVAARAELQGPDGSLDTVFDIDPGLGRIRIGSARLVAMGVDATARGVIEDWGRRSHLMAHARANDLAPIAGIGRARVHLAGDLLNPDLRAVAALDTGRLATGIEILDRLLGDHPRARALVAVGTGWRARILSGTVEGARAGAVVSGPLQPLALGARLTVPDLSVFAATLSGAGVARGRVRLDSTWGVAAIDRLAIAGVPPATGSVGFDFDIDALAGTFGAAVTMMGRPVAARTRLVIGDVIRIEKLAVRSGASRVEGDLTIGDDGVRGTLDGDFPRLAEWSDLVGTAVAGRLRLGVVLDGAGARVDARAAELSAVGVEASAIRLQGIVTGLADGPPAGRATVTADGLRRGDVRFETLRASVQGGLPQFRFTVDGDGPARLSTAGSAQIQGPRGAAALDRLSLAVPGVDARLAAPTRVLWGPDGYRVERTQLIVGQGRVTAQGQVVRGRLDADARLDGLPLELVEQVSSGMEAVGLVDGSVTVGGTLAAPTARFDLRGRQVGFAAAARAGIGNLAVTLDATLADGRVEGSASADDGRRLRLAATGSVPLEAGQPVSARIEMGGDLARLTDALPLAGHVFAGRLDGNAVVAGTMADPRIEGRVTIADGRYENLETGTLVSAMTANARFDGLRVVVEARGTDGRRGTIALDGGVSLDGGEPEWRGDVTLADFRAVRRDDVRATISAKLALQGTGARGRLSGQASVEGAEVDIGRMGGAGPVNLDVVEINRPGAEPAVSGAKADPTPLTVALAIQVDVARAFVRGRGLDSEWGGAVAIGGTLSDPSLTGRLVAERGRFELLGKAFRLSPESAVIFDGQGIRPRLDVAAEAKAEEIVARVAITGSVESPKLDITSQPLLPQEEVLSRVLFGTEAGKLSAFQQIQLGQMAASGLTGGGAGFDPIGGLRGALGLDVLEVGQAEEGGTALTAGKYIGEDTFLRVEQGTQGAGRVTVERELGGGFSVTTEVGQERGGGVGVEWRKDY